MEILLVCILYILYKSLNTKPVEKPTPVIEKRQRGIFGFVLYGGIIWLLFSNVITIKLPKLKKDILTEQNITESSAKAFLRTSAGKKYKLVRCEKKDTDNDDMIICTFSESGNKKDIYCNSNAIILFTESITCDIEYKGKETKMQREKELKNNTLDRLKNLLFTD